MRKIELNPDGTLNILDPHKVYVLRVDWGNASYGIEGIKYYFPKKKSTNYWIFEREGGHTFRSFQVKDLQYVIEQCLIFLKRDYQETAFFIAEFKDMSEFETWKASQ